MFCVARVGGGPPTWGRSHYLFMFVVIVAVDTSTRVGGTGPNVDHLAGVGPHRQLAGGGGDTQLGPGYSSTFPGLFTVGFSHQWWRFLSSLTDAGHTGGRLHLGVGGGRVGGRWFPWKRGRLKDQWPESIINSVFGPTKSKNYIIFGVEQKFQSLAYLTFQPVNLDVESNRFGKLQTRLLWEAELRAAVNWDLNWS